MARYIRHDVRCVVAARQGAVRGREVEIRCPHCGAHGRLSWSNPKRARYPGEIGAYGLHLDHIVPRALGGPDTADNLQYVCDRCNIIKSDRVVI
jgi:5-methylcytosine-specific restriction endonuclease McrA